MDGFTEGSEEVELAEPAGVALEWERAPSGSPFVSLVDVAVGREGVAYALDAGAGTVVRLSPLDAEEWRFGRRGQGPGEFMSAHRVLSVGFEVVVPDVSGRRLLRFDENGGFVGQTRIPQDLGIPTGWGGAIGERVTVRFRSVDVPGAGDFGGSGDRDILVAVDLSRGDVEELQVLPAGAGVTGGRRPTIRLLAPEPIWQASRDGWIAVGMNDAYDISLYERGREVTVIRGNGSRQEVDSREKSELVDRLRADMLRRGAKPEQLTALASMVEVDDWYPVLVRVMFGPSATILIQPSKQVKDVAQDSSIEFQGLELQGIESPIWDVFGRDGAPRGRVRFPPGFRPTDSDDHLIYGVFGAADGTQTVRAYRLTLEVERPVPQG